MIFFPSSSSSSLSSSSPSLSFFFFLFCLLFLLLLSSYSPPPFSSSASTFKSSFSSSSSPSSSCFLLLQFLLSSSFFFLFFFSLTYISSASSSSSSPHFLSLLTREVFSEGKYQDMTGRIFCGMISKARPMLIFTCVISNKFKRSSTFQHGSGHPVQRGLRGGPFLTCPLLSRSSNMLLTLGSTRQVGLNRSTIITSCRPRAFMHLPRLCLPCCRHSPSSAPLPQMAVEAAILVCVNLLGIYWRFMSEVAFRRAFLDKRGTLESKFKVRNADFAPFT